MDKYITARQAGIIAFLCVLANKFLLLPSYMFKDTKSDSIFVMIFLFGLDLLMLPIFFWLKKKYPNEKLFDIISQKLTKPVAIVFYIAFAIYFLFKTLIIVNVVYVYLKQQVYQEDFLGIAIMGIIPVVSHAAVKGIKTISRTAELFFLLVVIGFVSCLGFSLFTTLKVPVLFTTPVKQFLQSTYKYTFSFGDFLILFLIIDKVKIKKGEEKKIYKFSISAMALILALFILYYAKFEVTSFMHNDALSDILVFSVQFNAIGRLDIISMLTIMFISLFEIEIFCFGFCDSVENIFPLLARPFIVALFDILSLLCYFILLAKYETIIMLFSGWLSYLGIFINYVFPLICLVITIFAKFNNKEFEKSD